MPINLITRTPPNRSRSVTRKLVSDWLERNPGGGTLDEMAAILHLRRNTLAETCPAMATEGVIAVRPDACSGKAHQRKRYFAPHFAPPEVLASGPAAGKAKASTSGFKRGAEVVYSSKFTGIERCNGFVAPSFAPAGITKPIFSRMRIGQYEPTGSAIERQYGQRQGQPA